MKKILWTVFCLWLGGCVPVAIDILSAIGQGAEIGYWDFLYWVGTWPLSALTWLLT